MLLTLLPGALLLVFTLFDALWTTIVPRGAGPLSKRIARGWWAASLWVHRRREAHGLLSLAGPALLVTACLVWVCLLWLGWLLVFSTVPDAVVASSSQEPASLSGRIYYVGFVLFTLGTGDYEPVGATWEILTAVASLTGLFTITLAITYILSVISAVTAKRQLAATIFSLGETAPDLVCQAWDGQRFPGLDQHLPPLGSSLEHHTQRHLAYPILHYFHSSERRTALAPALAMLDEALWLLTEGVAAGARPAPAVLLPARRTVGSFLDTLRSSFIHPAESAPPAPPLLPLRRAGIPGPTELGSPHSERRRLLRGLVEDGGWTWQDVETPASR